MKLKSFLRNFIWAIFILIECGLTAQIPHTPTFPGADNPVFPYIHAEKVGVPSKQLDFLRNEIISWVEKGELIGGEVLIVKDGYTIFHEAFGWFDFESKTPMVRNAMYHTGSMSKPFSTALILKLHEQEVLSVDDPVQKYIDNFPDATVKIHHLMNHTSGFSGWGPDGENHENLGMFQTLEDWVRAWTAMGQTLPVGVHHYTNYNNAALILIAEKATHVSGKALTEELLLNPYGLKNTDVYPVNPNTRKLIPPLYRWTDESGYKKVESFEDVNWPAYAGAFGIFSTAEDYALFMQYWMNQGSYDGKGLLKKQTVFETFSNNNSSASAYEDGSAYGYGWYYKKGDVNNDMPLVFWHGGIMRSYAMAFPPQDLLVVYMTHSWKSRSHREAFIDRFYKSGIPDIQPADGYQKYDPEKANFIPLTEQTYRKYTGIYEGKILVDAEIPLKIELSYRNGFLESRGSFPGLNIETYNQIGFANANDAHPVVNVCGKVTWYNPEIKLKFIESGQSIVGYEVYRNGTLEAVLNKIK